MIVIEGMDNSGKSTLAVELAGYLGKKIQESEGRPIDAHEINVRVDRYNAFDDVLFVRHPCISNAIYGQIRPEGNPITTERTKRFYDNKPVLIYCDAGCRGLGAHVKKAHDTKEHLKDIEDNYNKLLFLYRQWAAERAHFVYRIGDDVDRLVRSVFLFNYITVTPKT